mgnify:CR=1 FL=1
MRLFELSGDEAVQDLIVVLRNQIQRSNQSNSGATLSWQAVSNLMRSMGHGNYNYGSFKTMFDQNEDLKSIVRNFNQDGIELNTQFDDPQTGEEPIDTDSSPTNTVQKMAKRATNRRS